MAPVITTGGARGRPPLTADQRRAQRLTVSRAAVRLFREHGLAAVSGGQVAAAAGISERTLWRLFRAKESCVEPVLTAVVEGVREALLAWPVGVDLSDYLRVVSASQLVAEDTEAALAVIRMSSHEPALRAVWLLLQESTEPVLAAVIAPRLGLPAEAPEVRVRAATMNAALRVLADAVAAAPEADHGRLVAALHDVVRVGEPPAR